MILRAIVIVYTLAVMAFFSTCTKKPSTPPLPPSPPSPPPNTSCPITGHWNVPPKIYIEEGIFSGKDAKVMVIQDLDRILSETNFSFAVVDKDSANVEILYFEAPWTKGASLVDEARVSSPNSIDNWGPPAANLNYGGLTYNRVNSSGTFTKARVWLNVYPLVDGTATGPKFFERTVIHEMGHVAGLGHNVGDGIMTPKSNRLYWYSDQELELINWLY